MPAPPFFSQLIGTQLNNNAVIPGLGTGEKRKSLKWLKPTNSVAKLDTTMCVHKIRTIPILDDELGKFRGLVSKVDAAKVLTPPQDKLPLERLAKKGFVLDVLIAHTTKMGAKQILDQEAFGYLLDVDTASLIWTASLEEAINKLLHRENNRRYRTLPIFDEGNRLVGTLSYVDILRIIKDARGIDNFLTGMTASQVLNPKVETRARNQDLTDGIYVLNNLPFTHIPITTEESKTTVVGIVDDIAIRTLEHPLLLEYLDDMPLGEIMTKVSAQNTVNPAESVKTLIGKFVDGSERPTAILVGNNNDDDKFQMAGIVSYVDIFKKLLEFLRERNENGNIE